MRLLISLAILIISFSSGASEDPNLDLAIKKLTDLASQSELIKLATDNNNRFSLDEIMETERNWSNQPKQRSMHLDQSIGYYFQDIIDAPGSPFIELILMGVKGETLAAYPVTSDYWQGDEDKFAQVRSNNKYFVDQLDWDQSTKTISAQISVPIQTASGEFIGVLTGGVEASLSGLGGIPTN